MMNPGLKGRKILAQGETLCTLKKTWNQPCKRERYFSGLHSNDHLNTKSPKADSWLLKAAANMYSRFQLAKRYLRYWLTAANGKGHGIHSPFVFDFVKNVLNDSRYYEDYQKVEKLRNSLLKNNSIIEVEDLGAGSTATKKKSRKVSSITRNAAKPAKYGQLLFRIVKYYKPEQIIELGTSMGLTTSYLALANQNARLVSIEGAPAIAGLAQRHFEQLALNNITIVVGNFDDHLPAILSKLEKVDLAFVDGNHRRDPTLQYFKLFGQKKDTTSILIFDDIHWSAEMEEAWETIKADPSVTVSIDLFFIGVVFFRKEFKVKQHFIIRY